MAFITKDYQIIKVIVRTAGMSISIFILMVNSKIVGVFKMYITYLAGVISPN